MTQLNASDQPMHGTVVIIGAGPAGLTAAIELLQHGNRRVIVLEALDCVGGISRTINYRGNRMDIGGHRFFSKSDWVMNWWKSMMPLAPLEQEHGISTIPPEDEVLLIRPRLSRIFFAGKFFDYPLTLTGRTMANLGAARITRIAVSYAWSRIRQIAPEHSLEDFFINRFGGELYRTFFKDYTEKVWGVACKQIDPAWGAQRIKGLSVTKTVLHALRRLIQHKDRCLQQQRTATSLIERFLYPKHGPGQMWEVVARNVTQLGGTILRGHTVLRVQHKDGRVVSVVARTAEGREQHIRCDHLISSMPVADLMGGFDPPPPAEVATVAAGLRYRDFITVGVLAQRMNSVGNAQPSIAGDRILPDNWLYIQEPGVHVGRIQIFNNWCPALVRDPDTAWLGMEYFCQEGDELWSQTDAALSQLAADELHRIGLVDRAEVLDSTVVRVPKAYPAYFGAYEQFHAIKTYTNTIPNLFLIGRNGMHRYNNQDHSMLTARRAVDCILNPNLDKQIIWNINVDDEYHEEQLKADHISNTNGATTPLPPVATVRPKQVSLECK